MKKFISAICVIALMMPSTLSAFADAGTADNLSGQQAVVVDVADSTEDAAETETETVVETESASVVSTEKASDTKATSDTSKASETETMDETEDEPEVDPQYADDPQYWKEMKKQYGVATMSAVPDDYIHNSRFSDCVVRYGVDVSSYQGTESIGDIRIDKDLDCSVKGLSILLVEDIVDTGLTMQRLLETLGTRNPKEIHIASLLVKPDKLKVDLNIEYVAMEIPNDFIVGYGLDYDGFGRNYADIYTVVD